VIPKFITGGREITSEGFVVTEKPERCIVKDGFLDLKGKKLVPLETSKMKLALILKKKGKFVFTPKIKFMEEGEHKPFELE